MSVATNGGYVLGHDVPEMQRLDRQAASLATPTRLFLESAGLAPGMTVLDLGTGTGEVAFAAADLVGPSGRVIGMDRSPRALAYAESKRLLAGRENVSFMVGEVGTDLVGQTIDAVIGRLVLAYLPDPVAGLRHHLRELRPGGIVVAMEYDTTALRATPQNPLAAQVFDWIIRAFEYAGTPQTLGPRLGSVLGEAGIETADVLGVQVYLESTNPAGPLLVSGVVRSLLPAIEQAGLATRAEVDIDTLGERFHAALLADDAVMLPPTLVGAWGRLANDV